VWEAIAFGAAAESPLWAEALQSDTAPEPVFSPLAPRECAIGVETIYEGYLVHYGRSRLFAPPDADTALLLCDYLYAHGLVRVAETGNADAVSDLAELISLCSQARAQGRDGDGQAWAATCALLGRGGLEDGRDAMRLSGDSAALERVARERAGDAAVADALAAHERLVG
jgi:hypothetical protein